MRNYLKHLQSLANMNSTKGSDVKIVLGDEFDEDLRKKLGSVIKGLGGKKISDECGIGGSQEFSEVIVSLGEALVTIESETYIGLSVSGPEAVIQQIRERMQKA
jgi:hypothetical protein